VVQVLLAVAAVLEHHLHILVHQLHIQLVVVVVEVPLADQMAVLALEEVVQIILVMAVAAAVEIQEAALVETVVKAL
jgi:hypothetical protein